MGAILGSGNSWGGGQQMNNYHPATYHPAYQQQTGQNASPNFSGSSWGGGR